MGNIRHLKNQANQKGFTLFEILFSLVIAAIILIGVIQALLYLTSTTTLNKRRAQVFQDVQTTMERIVGTSFSTLNATFPDNTALSNTFVANVLGGYRIPTESITVSYPGGTSADPREVVVTGSWNEQGANRSISLRTIKRG